MPSAMRHEDMGTPLTLLTKTVKSESAKSPAHAKGGHFDSIYKQELISRPLLYKWNQ